MKKTLLLLLTLVVSIVATGHPLTADEALQRVAQFMNTRRAGTVFQKPEALNLVVTNYHKIQDNAIAPSFYVFNVPNGQGYVIAAADDRIPAVLGYSDKGNIDPDNMPENMRAWLKGYSDQMEYLSSHPDAATPQKTVTGEAIEPLLGPIAWNQGSPYNDLCPMDGTVHSLTGCVATAMAQLMYFWKYPKATTDVIPGYTTMDRGFQMPDIPAKTSIDWENMLPKYKGNETEAQKQAVANLMLLCGTSLQMNYSNSFSGAWGGDVAIALRSYFDYDLATSFELHEKYRAVVWNQRVYDELKAGRPVYYDGDSSGSGHAFVVDGYGGDDYFHVNWGWGGSSNDYFLLSILDPKNNSGAGATQSADGYSMGQGAIFGMQPNTGVTPTEDPILTTNNWYADSLVIYRAKAGENFVFKIGFNFFNDTNNTYTFEIGIGVYSTSGELLGVVPGYSVTLEPGYGFWDPSQITATFKFGYDTDSAELIMKPVCRLKGSEEWREAKGAEYYFIHAVIDGNTLTLHVPTFGLTGTLAATGKKEIGSPLPVTAKITNNGTLYLGQIFYLVDGKMVGGCHFDLDPGDSATVDFSFIPEKAGKLGVSVCTRYWNSESQQYDYIPFIANSIDVATAPKADLGISLSVDNITDGYIKENVIKLKASIKNNGASVYDNIIKAELYKDKHDGTGYFSFAKRTTQTVKIENGQTIDVNFNFENLEDDNYLMLVYYISEGEWIGVKSKVYTVYTRPIPELTMTSETINAVKENRDWVVKTDSALVSVQVKNIGTVDYDNDILIYLYKKYNSTSGNRVAIAKTRIQLAVDADTTVIMQLDGLEDGANYFYYVYYMAGPKTVLGNIYSNDFTVKLEENGYYLVSDLNGWSTEDQSYPFERLRDGKTWTITFDAPKEKDLWLKVAPASAYNDQAGFWTHLFCAVENGCTDLTGTMIVGDKGAWLLPQTLNAETYTMRIVPKEMTYTITYTELPDGIQMVNGDGQDIVTIYGLNGNKVASTTTANVKQRLKSMPKGLYIVRSGQKNKTIHN
jgi:hypothetical protein